MNDTALTSAPIAASSGANAEFVDLHGLKRLFGIGRTAAYRLIELGDIRSVVLRQRGRIKGKRLIDAASVRTHLAKLEDEAKESGDIDPRLSALNRKANQASVLARKERAREKASRAEPTQ